MAGSGSGSRQANAHVSNSAEEKELRENLKLGSDFDFSADKKRELEKIYFNTPLRSEFEFASKTHKMNQVIFSLLDRFLKIDAKVSLRFNSGSRSTSNLPPKE